MNLKNQVAWARGGLWRRTKKYIAEMFGSGLMCRRWKRSRSGKVDRTAVSEDWAHFQRL